MSKWMKYTGGALVALAILALLTVWAGQFLAKRKVTRKIDIAVAPLAVTADAMHIEQGRYLFSTRGCADCHGANGAGKEVIRSRNMLVVSPNITAGANSVTAGYRTEDWVRTLRHGVKPDRTPVMIMPSEDFNRMPDDDLASLIAYIHTLAPVSGRTAVVELPIAVQVMYAFGMVRDAAEIIDHSLPPAPPLAPAVSLPYGAYVASSCISCHGPGFSGGRIPGSPPEWPSPANLTPGPGSAMPRYPTPEVFKAMFQRGTRPDGTPISRVMPFGSLAQMTDTDVRALHYYLSSLPPRPAGGR